MRDSSAAPFYHSMRSTGVVTATASTEKSVIDRWSREKLMGLMLCVLEAETILRKTSLRIHSIQKYLNFTIIIISFLTLDSQLPVTL